jgi:hypothetical protein
MVEIDLGQAYQIVSVRSHPTVRLAARELQETLAQICGAIFPISEKREEGRPALILNCNEGDGEGFTWQVSAAEVIFTGDGPYGLLYAVYSFLEMLGCCWFAPGDQNARIPQGRTFMLPDSSCRETPALPGRCLIIGHHAFMQDAADWIVWAGRNRLNTIFFHTTQGPLALGAVHESHYQALKPVFMPLMQERGMVLEHGGHGLADFLPRNLFVEMPETFRWRDGRRTPDHNFCPTSSKGLEIIRQNAARYFHAHPEVDIFHIWADDIDGGGWCDCENCREYSASEQLLLATNAVAEVLSEILPKAQISFIAYHDTEAAPVKVKPYPNVHMLWAPRMRCYAHAASDPGCPRNVPHYMTRLAEQVETFQSAGAAPARVFEYYLDAVLFKSLLPPLPTVMQQDARDYRAAGVHTMQALMTGDYSWQTPQLNVWLFPRLVWNPEQPLDDLIAQFSQAAFGVSLLEYYRKLETAFQQALDIQPEQVRLTVVHGVRQIWENPPTDMGDPVFAPLQVLEEKVRLKANTPELLAQASGNLQAAARLDARVRLEQEHFELVEHWLMYDLHRTRLYALVKAGKLRQAWHEWKLARNSLEGVYRWGRRFIPSPWYRKNYEFIQFYTWQVRLNKIRADHFSNQFSAFLLSAVTKSHLNRLYKYLRHLYTV